MTSATRTARLQSNVEAPRKEVDMSLRNKTILITGANRGIGRSLPRRIPRAEHMLLSLRLRYTDSMTGVKRNRE